MAARSVAGAPVRALALVVVVTGGCGPGPREIVDVSEVPRAEERPSIAQVIDLGDIRRIPRQGLMPPPDSDNHFSIGELVLIEGENFDTQPAVRIGGKSAPILARTGDGGIVCRIPAGISSGSVKVVVSHPGGSAAARIGVERNAVLVDRTTSQVHFLALGRGSEVNVRARIRIPGAFDARVSPDGRAAYVVANPAGTDETATLHVLSLTAAGRPKELRLIRLDLPRVIAFAVAKRAPLGAVIGYGKLVLIDLDPTFRPEALPAFPLVAPASALAMHPQGKKVALLSPNDNLLTAIDVAVPQLPRVERAVNLAPEEREPLAVDLEFGPGGSEVWVLLGDGPAAAAEGARPARIAVVNWETGRPNLERTVEVKRATGAPVALAVGRRATAARPIPILVATVNRRLYSEEPGPAPSRLDDLGLIVSTDLNGSSRVLSRQSAVFGDPQVSHDLAWAVSPTIRLSRATGGTRFELGLSFDPLPDTRGRYRFVKLGTGRPAGLKDPPSFATAP